MASNQRLSTNSSWRELKKDETMHPLEMEIVNQDPKQKKTRPNDETSYYALC